LAGPAGPAAFPAADGPGRSRPDSAGV